MNQRLLTGKETKERRSQMCCRTFEIKVDISSCNKTISEHLERLFAEAKWYYNYIISVKDIKEASTTITTVPVKVGEIYEQRELKFLSGQMRQGIKQRTWDNLKSISAKKKKGEKVGWLKFKSFINSIPLVQHNATYTINKDKKTIKIQKLKCKIKVYGLEQLENCDEIACAMLVKKPSGFYFHISTYTKKYKIKKKKSDFNENSTGVDFGCETPLVLSNGIKINFSVPVNKRIKQLDRKIQKKKRPRSKNKKYDQYLRRKEYEKLTNKKGDIRNKVIHVITDTYKYVCVQDESIGAWQASNHGKAINRTAIGGIISDLKRKSRTSVVVDKWYASTQICPQCGKKNKLELKDRVYECECGFKYDRDVKSAHCIEVEGMRTLGLEHKVKKLPTDRRDVSNSQELELKPKDMETSTIQCLNRLNSIVGVMASLCGRVEEASRSINEADHMCSVETKRLAPMLDPLTF